ncbi:CLUMA_CG003137, isoform A [Clunio marinus]|uniref:CLUMA_CG003137, isoform A n=1 Tax=Clunio marinus TaxID=568069 RepID=A0A1J1HMV1_9DIPT|nr:CLUMA_CG003137, isoform A [Clunio marinus]
MKSKIISQLVAGVSLCQSLVLRSLKLLKGKKVISVHEMNLNGNREDENMRMDFTIYYWDFLDCNLTTIPFEVNEKRKGLGLTMSF